MNWRETVTLRDSAWCMFGMAVPEFFNRYTNGLHVIDFFTSIGLQSKVR